VIPYYERFLAKFPDVQALAASREADVLACWSGLGYYSRARNLRRAAQAIVAAGKFPRDYDAVRQLPGVGPYTAAAVTSIAFNAPHAVVDGNVLRVIARLKNDSADIGATRTRARFQQIADELLDRRNAGRFNQAMMELGATVCLPGAPQCSLCPVAQFCEARKAGRENELPVKLRKPAVLRIELHVAIVENSGRVLLRRRADEESLMAGFWELPAREDLGGALDARIVGSFRHTITHHHYTVTVSHGVSSRRTNGFRFWHKKRLGEIPLTTITRKALALLTSR
jgi:A/G-specific adenine glycosylase